VHAGHNVAAEYGLGIFPAFRHNIFLRDIIEQQGDQVRGPDVQSNGIGMLLSDIDHQISIPGPTDDAGECGLLLDNRRDPSQNRERDGKRAEPHGISDPLIMSPSIVRYMVFLNISEVIVPLCSSG
jgi:hypothetical protein